MVACATIEKPLVFVGVQRMIEPKPILIFEGIKGEGLNLTEAVAEVSIGRVHVQARHAQFPTRFRGISDGGVINELWRRRIFAFTHHAVEVAFDEVVRLCLSPPANTCGEENNNKQSKGFSYHPQSADSQYDLKLFKMACQPLRWSSMEFSVSAIKSMATRVRPSSSVNTTVASRPPKA